MKHRRQNRRRNRAAEQAVAQLSDLPRVVPKLSMLGTEDRLRIHQASCEILHKTGVQVFSQEARDLLRNGGAVVGDDDIVKIPPSMVERALASAPESFNLYKRGKKEVAIRLDGKSVYFGPGSDTFRYLDPRSGKRRDFHLSDLADCYRMCDALPEIGFVMSIGVPRDLFSPPICNDVEAYDQANCHRLRHVG